VAPLQKLTPRKNIKVRRYSWGPLQRYMPAWLSERRAVPV
jgi:hypothetical protein